MVFYFINLVFIVIFNGFGNSKIFFCINIVGLIINIIFDFILIFGWGFVLKFGVVGVVIVIVFVQIVVIICFIYIIVKSKEEYFKLRLFKEIEIKYYKVLYKLGLFIVI